MRIALSVPATNERGPQYAEQAFASIHQANPERFPLSLQLLAIAGSVSLACEFPPELRAIVEGQLFAQYPDARIEPIAAVPFESECFWTTELSLHPDLFPIRRFGEFEDGLNRILSDPLASLLTTIAPKRPGGPTARVELLVRPATAQRRRRAEKCLHVLTRPFFQHHHRLAHWYCSLALSPHRLHRMLAWMCSRVPPVGESHAGPFITVSASHAHEREDDLQAAASKLSRHLFETRLCLIVEGTPDQAEEARQKLREMAGAFGLFSSQRLGSFHIGRITSSSAPSHRHESHSFLLSTEELATLWHPSTATVRTPTMATVESREFEPPLHLPTLRQHDDLAVLGATSFRSRRDRFGILPNDRLRHLAILGKTGMGKTTLISNLIISDIRAGRGVCLIDPHGDLCEQILAMVPSHRTNDVILFDAGDAAHPLAFNPLFCPDPSRRPLVASGVVSALKKQFGDSWGPRLEHILRNTLLAVLEVPGSTFISVLRMLSDVRFRQSVVRNLSDPLVRAFWEKEFAAMPRKLQTEAISPIQNKVGQFVSSPLLRNIIGQSQSRLNLREAMDAGRVLIVGLSKGKIGDDSSSLMGSLFITGLQLAAMSRADIPEWLRRDFHVYVDEFQNFATDSFGEILSEARKYRLSLTLANQFLSQMSEQTAAAVFGNIGSLVTFQVGASDAETLTMQLGGGITPQDLMRLPRYRAYARLLIDGQPSQPFSMQTLPPAAGKPDEERAEIIRRYSRQRYCKPASMVERELAMAFA